jgi:zinc and cadmium transporter
MLLPWTKMIILVLSALLGGALVIWKLKPSGTWLKLLISFSGALLLGLCMVHLIPFSMHASPSRAGLLVMGGFLLQLLLEYFSEGIEHGHAHHHQSAEKGFPFVVMLSLCVHSLIEGMPFGHHGHEHGDRLLIGIVMHNLPVGMVLAGMLMKSGISKLETFMWISIFALMAPLGTILYATYLNGMADQASIEVITGDVTAVMVGILLHVSTTILFEADAGHRFNLLKFVSIITGFILSALIF